eukprot:TRINITY_DN6768_c0_g1_i6.p1 TRINITY_DN6768_c0_g1~~TRINITY_DN6768_c0_g1_i6.p1  ORF type:complete len:316 (+),score=44.88 TRINITY_DN6768_c0_g1_i6:84-1031(+)
MTRCLALFFFVKLSWTARISTDGEASHGARSAACLRAEIKYTKSMKKIESSVGKGENISEPQNIYRWMLAGRGLKAAQSLKCKWLEEQKTPKHEKDYPHVKKTILALIGSRPCHDQILAYLKSQDIENAMKSYLSKEDACQSKSIDTGTTIRKYDAIVSEKSGDVDDDDVEDALMDMEAQSVAEHELAMALGGGQSFVEMVSEFSASGARGMPQPRAKHVHQISAPPMPRPRAKRVPPDSAPPIPRPRANRVPRDSAPSNSRPRASSAPEDSAPSDLRPRASREDSAPSNPRTRASSAPEGRCSIKPAAARKQCA